MEEIEEAKATLGHIEQEPVEDKEAMWTAEPYKLNSQHKVILKATAKAWSAHPAILPTLDATGDLLEAE